MTRAALLLLLGCAADPSLPSPDAAAQLDAAPLVDAGPVDAMSRGDASSVSCPFVCEPPLVAACTYDPGTMTCACICEVPS